MSKKDESEISNTLTDDEIKATPTVGRRGVLGVLGGIAAGGAVAAILGTIVAPRRAEAQATDSDPNDRAGRGQDPAGRGRHCSDQDPNDGAGHGRHCSDSDQRH